MSLDITKYATAGNFGRVEDGLYPARLAQIVELGVQPMEDYQTGEAKDPKPRVILTFELPTETIEINGEHKPRWYGKEYTLSGHEKAGIVKVMKALDPSEQETDLAKLVARDCMIEIGTTSSGKAKVTNVSPTPKGFPIAELSKDPLIFDLDDPDVAVFKSFPEWVREKITEALSYADSELAVRLGDEGTGGGGSY